MIIKLRIFKLTVLWAEDKMDSIKIIYIRNKKFPSWEI